MRRRDGVDRLSEIGTRPDGVDHRRIVRHGGHRRRAMPCAVWSMPGRGLPFKARSTAQTSRPSLGVLVPAHNEERVIQATLESIRSQLTEGDRLLVIADNCSDTTARIARNAAPRSSNDTISSAEAKAMRSKAASRC